MRKDDSLLTDFSDPAELTNEKPPSTETETIELGTLQGQQNGAIGGSHVHVRIEKEEFAKLFQALPIPVFLLDTNGLIVFLNQACTKISQDYASFLGKSFPHLFYRGPGRREVKKVMSEVLLTRRVKRVKTTLGISRRVLWVRFHFRPLRMSDQRYLLVLAEDLTSEKIKLLMNRKHQQALQEEIAQRIEAEKKIRRSESKYRLLFDKAPVGIVTLDRNNRILFANAKAGEILGLAPHNLSKRLFTSFVHEEDRGLVAEANTTATTEGLEAVPYAIRIEGGFDKVKWVQINSVNAKWDGRPATLIFMEDITKRRELENEFLKMQKLESLGLLAGGIAHDFNNILTAILGNISLGINSLKNIDRTISVLTNAQRACVRAEGLTQQLLTFSKGGVPIKKVLALNSIITESCEFAFRGSNVSCQVSIADDLYPAEVDPAQITQVINNLAINANQAMSEGGKVIVQADNIHVAESHGLPVKPGPYVRIRVIDHGRGIPDDVLPHIFDPYFTTKDLGSGLGLTSAYSIVKNHGGAITVSSQPGVGSEFSIYLPASAHKPEPAEYLDDSPVRGSGRILVMDDEEVLRTLTKDALEQLGYDVVATRNGQEALDLFTASLNSSAAFSAVILDLTVPGAMGGLEAAGEIRKVDPSARIIISSGYSNDPVMANHRKYGIDAVVPKPYTIGTLTRTLQSVVGKHRNGGTAPKE